MYTNTLTDSPIHSGSKKVVILFYRNESRLGMVVHIYNPCYLGVGVWEDHNLRPAQEKVIENLSQ
jgi:hypothetical protein